jgi:hypothetical protein
MWGNQSLESGTWVHIALQESVKQLLELARVIGIEQPGDGRGPNA